MTVYAPYVNSYTSTTPYITAAEYMASPTGVNISQLVPRGTAKQNEDALNQAIARASSFIDIHCRQVLAATVDTQSGRYRIQAGGMMRIPVNFSPILAVNSVKVGFAPSSLNPFTDMSNLWIDRKVVQFPLQTMQMQGNYTPLYADGRVFVILEYVNGWANTLTTAASAVGDTTVTVDSNLGIQPGVELTIYDPNGTEVRTVVSVAGNVVTLDSPLTFAHDAGYSISALPAAVKQAAVLLTSALIKTRGSEAIVMSQMRAQPTQTVPIEDGGLAEIALAKELMTPFVRVM